MSQESPSDVFEAGRRQGQQDGAELPLTEEQERHVRVLLRQADVNTPPAARRKAS
jgi:hypothetical protein